MFCYFQRGRVDSIQEFQSMVLNLENKERMQDKEIKRNGLAYKWFLIDATMSIIFMLETVLSYFSSMVESYFSSLLLMHGQIVSRGDLTGLGHINILLDLSFTRDYRILLCIIDIMEKMLGFWDVNSFFPLFIWGVLGLWPSCSRMLWPFADRLGLGGWYSINYSADDWRKKCRANSLKESLQPKFCPLIGLISAVHFHN